MGAPACAASRRARNDGQWLPLSQPQAAPFARKPSGARGRYGVGDLRFQYDGSSFKRLTHASERDGIAKLVNWWDTVLPIGARRAT
jgi:hypothetical protein